MNPGIFAKTFARNSVEAVFDAVLANGLNVVQFNFACAGLEPMPKRIEPSVCDRIRLAAQERNIQILAVSGTFNLIDPVLERRKEGRQRLNILAGAMRYLDCRLITLCTGTRNAKDMWGWHSENSSASAWNDLVEEMEAAIEIADQNDVILGIEPEAANVVCDARSARRLLDEMKTKRLKIVFDAANLIDAETISIQEKVLGDAVELLGNEIEIAHGKDITAAGKHVAAGRGQLDYDLYLGLLERAGFTGPLILHGLTELEAPQSVAYVRSWSAKPKRQSNALV